MLDPQQQYCYPIALASQSCQACSIAVIINVKTTAERSDSCMHRVEKLYHSFFVVCCELCIIYAMDASPSKISNKSKGSTNHSLIRGPNTTICVYYKATSCC